jgi:hypothetical protein
MRKKARLPQRKLRPSIIVALELLGLEDPATPGQALAIVEKHLRDEDREENLERRLLIAGGRVIRTAPIKPGGTLTFRELLDVVHLHAALLDHGVFLRGAVTLGDVTARADFAAGPGLFEAERLRDEVACMPRVLVDPYLIRETEQNPDLRARHHTVPTELGYIRSLLREDVDGLWFVDYLKAVDSEVTEDYVRFLDEHRQLIHLQLTFSTTRDHSSLSWTWLRSYHNSVVEKCFEDGRIDEAERARLRVTTRTPLLYVFPPSTEEPD